jgi:hypothetical protein
MALVVAHISSPDFADEQVGEMKGCGQKAHVALTLGVAHTGAPDSADEQVSDMKACD